jgi:toxin ParE1/3/4
MAEIKWTEPALGYLNAIADYIANDNPEAANRLVRQVYESVDLLERFPELGRRVPEMRESGYREMIVRPCRIVYRIDGETVVVIFVIRGERELKPQDVVGADL